MTTAAREMLARAALIAQARSRAPAALSVGLLGFWAACVLALLPLIVIAHPDPAPFLIAALVLCIAVGAIVLVVIRALNEPAPGRNPLLNQVSLAAPVACTLITIAPLTHLPDVAGNLARIGAEVPGPTLIYLATSPWWVLLGAIAQAIAVYAWAKRPDDSAYAAAVAGEVLLLMACAALFAFGVSATWLPLLSPRG